MRAILLWFRRDLRLSDNPALRAAVDAAETVIPVYIHAPEEEGDWAPGAASEWWLHESLSRLADELAERGSRLVIRRGPTASTLVRLLEETGAEGVYWNRLYDPAPVARDRGIKQELRKAGYQAESFRGALMAEPWELRTGQGEPYRVFTPFWRAFARRGEPAAPRQRPRTLRAPARWPDSDAVSSLALLPRIRWDRKLAGYWRPGEAGAAAAMDRFLDGPMGRYGNGRDQPAGNDVSTLSPHLHFGEISPNQAWHRVQARIAGDAAAAEGGQAWLRQLVWREFAHHVLFEFPHSADQALYSKWSDFPWRENSGAMLAAWKRGQTGYPIVDAGMRQLWETGYMHNRVRMIVASLLVKNIRAPWQYGARWFWDTLVDADLANNSMGWQWSAGSGADAAPYFRIFNPFTQSRRFDPHGHYIRRWVPELTGLSDHDIHAPHEASARLLSGAGIRLGRDYPEPVVDYKQSRTEALEAARKVKVNSSR